MAILGKNELVQTRVRRNIKKLAMQQAERIGLPFSTIVTILITHFAVEGDLPAIPAFEIPNSETIEAMEESESGRVKSYDTLDELYAEIGIK